ncbi:LamG-like jellyroll fold domain-containing protein [Amycolatopsis sp. DSM 110486]|uniref:LamG-like jellyroll fold domain-containing protein n=1 Tax=Amycolatopsis sp. DSM 110486 TaxID=2865832 RepID=UPI0021038BB7|nr:LamG-like jellyroll fold domain-containing protein [Amycolatopsis sp. DSM 110486]
MTAAVVLSSVALVQPVLAAPSANVPDSAPDEATATAYARAGDKQVEVTSETTETSKTVANPDGSWTLTEYTNPVRVKQGTAWAPIDTTLERRPDGSIAPKAVAVDVSINPGGAGSATKPIVQAGEDGTAVGLKWTSDLPEPTLSGDTATYSEVLPGVDLTVKAATEGYTENLVIKTPEAAQNPQLHDVPFGLYTHNATVSVAEGDGRGTPAQTAPTDGLEVKNSSGEVIFAGDASRMWDSSGEGSTAEQQLGEGGGRREAVMDFALTSDKVTISPDEAFLADPKTKYPVSLDPDNWCTSCGIQSHVVVQSGFPTAHNWNASTGDLSNLKAGYEDYDSAGTSRSYIQMNTSRLGGTVIKSATLNTTIQHSYSCTPQPTGLWISNPGNSNTTWNQQPSWPYWVSDMNVANCHDAPNVSGQFDALRAAQDAAANHWQSAWFALAARDEGTTAAWRRFDLNPYFQVDYDSYPNTPTNLSMQSGTGKCVQGASRPWVATKTPQLAGSVSDPDGGTLLAGFKVGAGTAGSSTNVHDNSGSPVTVGTPGPNQAATAQLAAVPGGWIAGDGVYNWSMQVSDGQLSSPWVGNCEFTVDSVVPRAPTVSMTGTAPEHQNDSVHFGVSASMATAGFYDVDRFIYTTDGSEPQPQGSPSVKATQGTDANGNLVATADLSALAINGNQNFIKVKAVNKAGTPGPDATCVTSGNLDAASCSFHVLPYTPSVGLVGAWPLDEMGGRILADTANTTPNNDGLAVHTASLIGGGDWVAGYDHGTAWTHPDTAGYSEGDKGALTLDGSSGYVTTTGAVLDTTKSFSVGAWVKLANTNGFQTVISQDGNQGSGFYLQYSKDDNAWAFSMLSADQANSGVVRAKSTKPPVLGMWTHVAGTYDASTGTMTLYVDGAKQATNVITSWAANGNLVIGAGKYNGARADFLAGQVDDVQVWQRVLSAQDAHDLANAAVPLAKYGLAEGCTDVLNTTIPSLQSNWALDDGTGSSAGDTSAFGNTMTLNGGYGWTTGPATGAVHFDGSTGYGTAAPAVDTTQSFTVSAWAKLDDANGYYTLFTQDGQHTAAFQLRYSPDVNRWVFGMTTADDDTVDNYHWALGTEPPQVGTWTLLTGVFDQASMRVRLYVNGKLEGQNTVPTVWSAEDAFTVGSNIGVGNFFKGSVDQVQAWGQVLTDDQVAGLYGNRYFDTISKATGTGSGGVSLAADDNACAARFDGSGTGQIDAGRPANLRTEKSYTVEAWVYHSWTADDVAAHGAIDPFGRAVVGMDDAQFSAELLGYHPLADANGVSHPKWTMLISSSPTGPGAWWAVSDADAVDNTWVHLSATYDAATGTMAFYVNGKKQNTYLGTASGQGVTSRASTGDLFIGRGVWNGQRSDQWYGGVAGVRVYQGLRTANDIGNDARTDDPGVTFGRLNL